VDHIPTGAAVDDRGRVVGAVDREDVSPAAQREVELLDGGVADVADHAEAGEGVGGQAAGIAPQFTGLIHV